MEELVAEGLTEESQLAHWEWDNKGWQPAKIVQHFQLTPDTLQTWWSLKDVHEFCLKQCAIYATADILFHRELGEYLWGKWFQQGVTPCRFGNFFARFVGSYKPESPHTVPELLNAHRRICAQVLLRQVTFAAQDYQPPPQTLADRLDNVYEDHENYKLEATFHAVFIIVDTIPSLSPPYSRYRDQGFPATIPVLLVRTGEHHDLKTGPVDFASIADKSELVDGNDDVRRLTLGDAVDFVLDLHGRNGDGSPSY
ncbi:MAG: hypothetical protein Q9222_002740 [Ikaeria aurantiellina]